MNSADRIATELREWIKKASPGSRLPSSRELVEQYSASPVTVQKAMRSLVALGLVESRPGAGSFVLGHRTLKAPDFSWQTSALRSAPARIPLLSTPMHDLTPDAIGLHSGYPAQELLPERLVRSALTRASRGETAVSRSPAQGLFELQAWFASELATFTPSGISTVTPRDVFIVPGTQSGLSSIFRSLIGAGHPALMESPTYWGAILAAKQAGAQIVPISSDSEGPDPEDLARAFEETGARLFYAQPTFTNPTGCKWSPARREKVLSIVRQYGAFLIEDDWARDFAIDDDADPIAAYDDTGHVVYLRSLTKSVSPAVRVGAVIARGPVRDRLLADLGAESMYVSGILQMAALEVVIQPSWRTHLRGLRNQLRKRRDLLVASITEHMSSATLDRVPTGGLNLWVQLPEGVNAERLLSDCKSQGVLIAAGTEWFPSDPSGQFIRLNFAGPDPSRFPDATRVIGAAIHHQERQFS